MTTDQQIEKLINSIDSVAQASDPSIFELAIIPLLAGFIGAYAAYFFSMRQVDIVNDQENKSRIAKELSQCIFDLQNQSVSYWSKDYNREDINNIEIHEAHIHAGLILISSLSDQFTQQNMSVGERNELTTKLSTYISEAHETITGGYFESVDRKASKKTVMEIVSLCISIRAELSKYC